MKIPEMLEKIKINKIPHDAYTINEKPRDESLCMQKENGEWKIFYYERGIKTKIEKFAIEDDACDFFLKKLKSWFVSGN